MDEQNFAEKIGIVREMGEMKTSLATLSTQLESRMRETDRVHQEVKALLEKHEHVLSGNGREGLVTTVGKLAEAERIRIGHWALIYGAIVTLAAAHVYKVIFK